MNISSVRQITPLEANEIVKAQKDDCVLLDVRTAAEFESAHAEIATNIPLQSLSPETFSSLKGKKVICICQKGSRGHQAADALLKSGLSEVYNVTGGTEAWKNAGLPLVEGKSSISLERQVRIAAGSLVAVGVLGGFSISPYFYLLSMFVGCGLIFSGVTDTCGMALILSRCPWNKRIV